MTRQSKRKVWRRILGISWDPGLCLNWPEKFTCVLPELSKNLFLAKIQPCPWYLPFTIEINSLLNYIHLKWFCSTILRDVCESGREATATAEFCFLLKEGPTKRICWIVCLCLIYQMCFKFEILYFKEGPSKHFCSNVFIHPSKKVWCINVFQIWNSILQKKGPSKRFCSNVSIHSTK